MTEKTLYVSDEKKLPPHLYYIAMLTDLVKSEADILNTSLSSRMGLQHIEHERPSIC